MNIPSNRIPITQVNDTLENSIVSLDRARGADLTELSLLQSVKFDGLARDRARLVAKLGADHPRVLALDQNLATHKALLPVYKSEAAAATIVPPKVDAHSWAIHGVVLDSKRSAAAGVTVALYAGDNWDRQLGYSCTDANGYFRLVSPDVTKIQPAHTLRVLSNNKVVFVDPNIVTVTAGRLEYREVVLETQAAQSCYPPDGQQGTAPPSTGKP